MPFNLSPFEVIFVVAVLLLLFGAKRLPELGSGLGKGIREFKRSIRDAGDEVRRADDGSEQITDPAARPQVSQPRDPESVKRDV
jgi:sec-independent protein translocase protein TatA